MSDRGKDTGYELTEVRTVRSRAINAVNTLNNMKKFRTEYDSDIDEMIEALNSTIQSLDKWKRKR